jgi:hypothetical protein
MRGAPAWGLPRLLEALSKQVKAANFLMINFISSCERVAANDGIYFLEHLLDPGENRFPSIFDTQRLQDMEQRARGFRIHFHQCMFGATTRKPTCISSNIPGLATADGVFCTGESSTHVHDQRCGRGVDGSVSSGRFAAYPSGLCDVLGREIVQAFKVMHPSVQAQALLLQLLLEPRRKIIYPGLSVWKRQWNQLQS